MTLPKYTATTKRVFLPIRGHFAHFHDRKAMKKGHPERSFRVPTALPTPKLPIDWTKSNSLSFPMDGNDNYGDCMYAAGCHADNTFTGNVGNESVFDQNAIIQDYLALSGGDNGLDEGQLVGAWKQGLAGVKQAAIIDALDIDPTNPQLAQAAINLFGGVLFMLDVPDAWVNDFNTGVLWDAPATADQNNGHGVWWNGVDAFGNYKIQTWGTYCYITPDGVQACDPSAFVVFSLRWFNAQGVAPNGMTYDQLAALWVQAGGNALPTNPFVTNPPSPPPTPPSPPAPPTPPAPPSPPTPPPGPTPITDLEQFLQELIDEAFTTAETDAANAGDQLELVVLQTAQTLVDNSLPGVFGDIETLVENWINSLESNSGLRLRKNEALARIKGSFAKSPALQMLKLGVPLHHVQSLNKALPPGTLATILQDIIQYGPQVVKLILTVIQAIQGGTTTTS